MVVVGLLILLMVSSLIYRTFSVFTMMIDVERMHTLKFHRGVENFQTYRITGKEEFYQRAVENIKEANELIIPFVIADSIAHKKNKDGLRTLFLQNYGKVFNDKKKVDIMAGRVYFLMRFRFPAIEKMFSLAGEGLGVSNDILSLMEEYKKTGNEAVLEQINAGLSRMDKFYNSYSQRINSNINTGLSIILYLNFAIILLLALVSYFIIVKISSSISKSVNKLINSFGELEKGNLKVRLEQYSNDEIGMLVRSFNKIQESLERNDNRIKKDMWLRDGLEEVNKIINSDLAMKDIAEQVLAFIVKYLDCIAGTLYFKNDNKMELIASYGLDKKRLNKKVEKGDGIVGQVWKDLKPLLIKDNSSKGLITFTATGEVQASTVFLIPMFSKDEEPVAILEIAALGNIDERSREWLNIISLPVATALQVALAHEKITVLLEETQQQAEELETQQEELREANAELEEQTTLLRENQKKLQEQQEELRVSNEELEERTHDLEMQRKEILEKNRSLEEMKEMLKQKAEQLELTSKYKSEFLANMSHELRTPLNSMLILSKDLTKNKKGNLTEEQIESAKIIYNAGTDLLNLINDILDLSKIESGKMQVSPVHTSLFEIAEGMKNIFTHVAKERGIYFKTVVEEGLPDNLFTDRQRLDQIIKNLVSNAMKFTQEGGVTVRFRKNNDASLITGNQSPSICIDVEDTGIGIPEDKQQAIFEAFQQADGSISRKFGGTGLGLSISKQLAHMLGGSIMLRSEYGKGSVFTVCIPVNYTHVESNVKNTPEIEETDYTVRKQKKSAETTPVQNPKEESFETPEPVKNEDFIEDDRGTLTSSDNTILIIEDDKNFARVLVNHCHENGFKCIVTPTGEEGVKLAEQFKPDAISLDIKLPGMDGHMVLKLLKENPETRHIPVQVLSAMPEEDMSMDKGAFAYLGKPVSGDKIDSVLQRIKSYVNRDVKELLIVEDDLNTQKTLSGLLASKDVNITVASTGEKAVDLLKKGSYDGVILDLGLKDISGFDVIKKLNKSAGEGGGLPPIIVYTGRELTKEEMKELNKSVSSIIVKGERSEERLLDETALFLHQVVDKMDEEKKRLIRKIHDEDHVFEGKKILLVDDDMRNVFALTSVLNDHNMKVIEAENGLVALQRLEENPDIDLVLMDVMMPEMDGYTATQKIRENPDLKSLPVIILTAKAMKEDKEKALAAGASDYLTKPVDVEKLLSLIRVWLYK